MIETKRKDITSKIDQSMKQNLLGIVRKECAVQHNEEIRV
jgi:hypothetical protein